MKTPSGPLSATIQRGPTIPPQRARRFGDRSARVDEDNAAGVGPYREIGFAVARIDEPGRKHSAQHVRFCRTLEISLAVRREHPIDETEA